MKAEDLSIGDWVGVLDYHWDGSPLQAQISGIIKKHGTYYLQFGSALSAEIDCCGPIPITAGILEKNGFYSTPNVGYVLDYYNGYDGNSVIYDSWNHNLKITKYYKTVFDMEYFDDMNVHELQHALRLMGIDKEIKLEGD